MANTLIATLADLYTHGTSAASLSALTSDQHQAGLNSSADEAMGYFASRGNLPLVSWGTDLTEKVCHMAAYALLSRVGYNPDDGADKNIKLRRDDAITYLLRYSRGEITSPLIVFSTAQTTGSFPKVISRAARGW